MSMPDKKMLAVSRLPPSSKALMALSLRSSTGLHNVLGLWSIPFVYTSDITSVCAMYLATTKLVSGLASLDLSHSLDRRKRATISYKPRSLEAKCSRA